MGGIRTSRGTIGCVQSKPQVVEELPILFLHGVGSDKSAWQPQLDMFGARHHAIAADYPGYGESDFQPDATRDDYAAAMFALLDSLRIERAHICGLSLGGVVAIAMAHAAPERIASLTLADSFAVHPDGQAIYDRSVKAARDIGMAALAESRAPSLLGENPPVGLVEDIVATMARIDVEAYTLGARAVWLADQRDRAAAIGAPTLVLCGSEDRITPPSLSDKLTELIPGARKRFIAGAGHLANNERPGDFNRALRGFINGVD